MDQSTEISNVRTRKKIVTLRHPPVRNIGGIKFGDWVPNSLCKDNNIIGGFKFGIGLILAKLPVFLAIMKADRQILIPTNIFHC